MTFQSRLGQGRILGGRSAKSIGDAEGEEEGGVKKGFFASWSTASMQRSIEGIGVRRTGDVVAKSTEGMKLVLDRLRNGGLGRVLEGMKRDRDAASSPAGPWKQAWRSGGENVADQHTPVDRILDDE